MEAYGGTSGLLHLQDPAWRVVTKASGASQARRSCAQTPREFLSRRPDILCVKDGHFSVILGRRTCATNTFGEGGRSVRDCRVSLHRI